MHQLPALVEGVGAAHLEGGVQAPAHGGDGDGHVVLPGSGDDHAVQSRVGQQIPEIGIGGAGGAPHLCHLGGGLLPPILIQVADCRDVHILHGQQQKLQQAAAPGAQADKAKAYPFFHIRPHPFAQIPWFFYPQNTTRGGERPLHYVT